MCLGDRLKNPATITRVGMTLICLAFLSRHFLHRTGLGTGAADFVTGLLFGIAIAFLLWSLTRHGRGGASTDRGSG